MSLMLSPFLIAPIEINEAISEITEIVYGIDQMSQMPKNLKIMIRVVRSSDEYHR